MNKPALLAADSLVRLVTDRRAPQYHADSLDLAENFDAQVIETYWLIQAMQVVMPLGLVDSLGHRSGVLHIQPKRSGEPPPSPLNDVAAGRKKIASDPYFNRGLPYGYLSLLDTGVRASHVLLSNPSHLGVLGDCVNGGANCTTGGNASDELEGHGTSSAAILTGNMSNAGRFRGVTEGTLDCFKVYFLLTLPNGSQRMGLNACAAVRAFENTLTNLDRVIVAEMQGATPGGCTLGAIEQAADNAFNAGAAVIAANGNFGPPPDSIGTPAIARRVIGAGCYDLEQELQVPGQSWGQTIDKRYKPDIQAPTNVETATNGKLGQNRDLAMGYFGGTSGATPFVAGAAALLRNWVKAASVYTDPGHVYAQLILAGRRIGPFTSASQAGAGPIELPSGAQGLFGKVSIGGTGVQADIPLWLPTWLGGRLEVALWWPEELVTDVSGNILNTHSDINLELLDLQGVKVVASDGIDGVFERTTVQIPPPWFRSPGRPLTVPSKPSLVIPRAWKLRIIGKSVRHPPQTVYWCVALRR